MAFVYILANQKNGTLYVGVTAHLVKRVWEHKNKVVEGFTSKYNVDRLVYYEIFDAIYDAIKREKRLKSWPRQWKIDLIESSNAQWNDLYDEITQ